MRILDDKLNLVYYGNDSICMSLTFINKFSSRDIEKPMTAIVFDIQ